jgi:hypothetical protein
MTLHPDSIGDANFIQSWQIKNTTYNELIATGSIKILRDEKLRKMLDEIAAFSDFALRQLEFWRNAAVPDFKHLRSFKKRDYFIIGDSLNIGPTLFDLSKLRNDKKGQDLYIQWMELQRVFKRGCEGIKEEYLELIRHIECLQGISDCEEL